MASLGSFGTVRPAVEPDVLDWFGVAIRTNPDLTDLALADFIEVASSVDVDDPRQAAAAMGTVKGFLRESIHRDDFDTFWTVGKQNRQNLTDLLTVAMSIVTGATGRPTGQPSDSTDGLRPTPASSPPDAASVVAQAYPGRPDMQVAMLRAVS